MRMLSPAQLASTAQAGTEPRFFVFLELDQEYRLSTRENATLNGDLYTSGQIRIDSVSGDACQLAIYNEDYRHTLNALNGAYLRNRVRVYWAYGEDPRARYVTAGYWNEGYTDGPNEDLPAAFLLFDGIIDGTPFVDNWMNISARKDTPKRWPAVRIKPPFANHAPSAGYVIQFDGQALRIQGQ
jgi:hypothetical protein